MAMDSQRGPLLKPQRNLKKHQHMSEDEQKQFVLQKNGNYTLALSNIQEHGVECIQGECVLSHLGQQEQEPCFHLNLDELGYMLKNKTIVQDIISYSLPNAEKKIFQLSICGAEKWYICTGPFCRQKDGVESVQGECVTVTFGTTRIRSMFH